MYTAWAKMEECLVCSYLGPLVNGQRVTSNLPTRDMILFEKCQTIIFVGLLLPKYLQMRFAAAHPLHGLSGRWKKQLN